MGKGPEIDLSKKTYKDWWVHEKVLNLTNTRYMKT